MISTTTSGPRQRLGGIEKALASRSNQWLLLSQDSSDAITLGTLRARMNYFDACHWKARGDRAKQRECLDKALATQFYDIEVLIECYQIPDRPGRLPREDSSLDRKATLRTARANCRPWHKSCCGRTLQQFCLANGEHRGRP